MRQLTGQQGADRRQAAGRTLPTLLADIQRQRAGSVAMRDKHLGVWREHRWAEVWRTVRHLAQGLGTLGLRPGDVVAAVSENVVELYWFEYAALCWGCRVVCLYPDVSAPELEYILGNGGARLLLAEDQEQVDKALGLGTALGDIPIVHLDDRGLWHYRDPRLLAFRELLARGERADADAPGRFDERVRISRQDDPAVLCYTSGTTGRPKGVVLTHRYLLDNAYRLMAAFGLPAGAEYLSYISPAWAAEQITGLALGLLAPMTVNFAEKPETVKKDLRELGPQFLLFTPRQWEMLASEVQARMMDAPRWRQALYAWAVETGHARGAATGVVERLRRRLADVLVLAGIRDNLGLDRAVSVLSGGAGMSAEVFRLFRAFGVPLSNLYGSTELGLVASHWAGAFAPETMGELLPTDPTLGPPLRVSVADDGELVIQEGVHFQGYWREEAGTAKARSGGGFRTGDAVRLRDDGQLIFLDRMKDVRRLAGGASYPPQFIENHLRASPFIKDAMVLGDERLPFVSALVNIDPEIAGRFAERHGLAFGTFAELSQLPAVREQVAEAIRPVNRLLDGPARVRRFATLPKELDPDDAELTRSRKLRREQIEKSYRDIVQALYAGACIAAASVHARYRDGQTKVLRIDVALNDVEAADA